MSARRHAVVALGDGRMACRVCAFVGDPVEAAKHAAANQPVVVGPMRLGWRHWNGMAGLPPREES